MEGERKWVLVVDDNKFVREAVSDIVSLLGFNVARASNGREALALFSRRRYELILTDFYMPGMDGFELASQIKRKSPSIPVVLVTGSRRACAEKTAENIPFDHVVFKPFVMEEIVDTVKSLTAENGLVMQ
ncbi:MAG: response regulator [Desulfobacteraceae bacterium]|nr:MAG: response regulator [Desulfobacteraceae bacterium]